MSGQKKGRALALTAIMVLSVIATGMAFTGGVAAQDQNDGGNYVLEVQPDNVTTGGNAKSVEVTINDTYDDGTLNYKLENPDGDKVDSGQTTDDTFTVSDDFNQEGDYQITVNDADGTNTSTAPVTSKYDATLSQMSAAVNSGEVKLTGNLADGNGDGVSGESVAIRDPGDNTLSSDLTQNNGDFELNFAPDETGTYDVFDPETGVVYEGFEVTPTDLTVMSNQTEVTAGVNDTVDFTVYRDGEQVTGDDLTSLGANISQAGGENDVAEGGGYVDADDDENDTADTYRVGIDADEDTSDVIATFSNDTASGMTTLNVETTGVDTNTTNPLTKGVQTGVEFTATGPDGDDAGNNSNLRFTADGGTVELSFNDSNSDLSVNTGDSVSSDNSSYELNDGESITVDDSGDSSVPATAFAYNASGDLDNGVQLDVASQTDDDGDDSDGTYGDNTTVMFKALNGEAEPDAIPVTGDSAVDVTTTDAQGDDLNRLASLMGAGVDVSGQTGDNGMTTFSVNPNQEGMIDLNVSYDEDLVDGDTDAPDSVKTDEVLVRKNGNVQRATVNFENQTSDDGKTVTVDSVFIPNDGYVAIHNATQLQNGKVQQSVIGVSEYLTAGQHDNVQVRLFDVPGKNYPDDKTLDDGDQTLIAMPHKETNGNEQYNFITSDGSEDGPYTDGNGNAVVDAGVVTYNAGGAMGNLVSDQTEDFGEVDVGDSTTQRVFLRNAGDADVTVGALSIDGDNADAFSVDDNTPFTLAPGETRGVSVTFAPTEDGDASATLTASSRNDGAATTDLVGTGNDTGPEKHTLTVDGNDGYTFYSFRATGDVELTSTPNTEDRVRQNTASGAVGQGSDSYTFVGDLRNLYLQKGADVTVDGEQIDADSYKSAVSFTGSDEGVTAYTFELKNGRITGTDDLSSEDSVDADNGGADGAVRAGKDTYRFKGTFAGLDIDGDGNVVLNGQSVDPSLFYNTLNIEGQGTPASYDFTVSGEIKDTQDLTSEDSVSENAASGAIRGGRDKYVYSGTIEGFDADGDVGLTLNGEDTDASAFYNRILFRGDGSYSFSVSGEVKDGDRLSSEDSFSGNSGMGAVANGGVDGYYTYSGLLSDLTTDDGVTAIDGDGDEIDG